ncbi:MAG: AMP-binding protein [Verrucomicrobia bacterium]|jgi:acyl-CoA synthetase (AMP-forming)/AMP-acid ligase II|nr:AMP-binding protein [Verrucomicrobiota bacterium]
MNLVELLEARADQCPNQTALIDGHCGRERMISFASLQTKINACAQKLQTAGLGTGTQTLVLVPMQAELYITLAALWKIGATALFLDPSAGRQHIAECCLRTRPAAVIGIPSARLLWWLNPALRRIPKKLVWGHDLRIEASAKHTVPAATVAPDTPAILTFTSGSTGAPKGAIRTHGLLHAQYRALESAIELKAGEIELATMPIIALVNLAAGITTLIPDADLKRPGFVKIKPILQQIKKYAPNRCVASPAFLQRFPPETGSLQKIYTGGAPVFPRGLRHIQAAFPESAITVLYGSTEAEPISHVNWSAIGPEEHRAIAAGAGLPVGPVAPETEVRIIQDQWGSGINPESVYAWNALQCPLGQTGEIVVTGDHVIPGYLDGIGDVENKIHVAGKVWHRTGDAGYFDARGRLWLMGRCAAKFRIGTQSIYPFALECAAVEHFNVAIAACCESKGEPTLFLPDSFRGPLPRTFYCDPITIHRVARIKIPLDKRHNAKVDYTGLQAL